jgi:hypothetical protein
LPNLKARKASREEFMERPNENNAAVIGQPSTRDRLPHDWARLIRKLRWIGLEDEAKRLELAVSTLPPAERERDSVSFGPFSTD